MPALAQENHGATDALEEKYQSIFENALTGIFQTSLDGHYLNANPALARMYGYDSPEALITSINDIEHQLYVDPKSRREFLSRIEEEGSLPSFEVKVRTRDLREIWILETARAVRGADGRILFYEGTVKDITASKQAELALLAANEMLEQRVAERTEALEKSNEELRRSLSERNVLTAAIEASQARYQRICANAPGMVYQFVLHADGSMSIPFASEGCLSFCGREPEEIERDAMILIRMIHPDDLASFQSSIAGSAATLVPWKWHGRFIHADGSVRWMQGGSRPERQPNGDVLWDGFIMDVTQLYRAQVALRETEVRKAAILKAALEAIITTDEAGQILEVNPATERIFGYRAAAMVGRNIAEVLVPPHLLGAYHQGLRDFLNADAGQLLNKHLELPAMRADGTEFPIELGVTAVRIDGHTFFTGHVRDITERREHETTLRLAKEEAERANAAKSEFLSRMSHELRTPLNAILGFSQLLQRRPLDARQEESVGFIAKAGRHLLELVNEVLDLARIEAGRTSVSLESVAVHEILQESLDLVPPAADERRITLLLEPGSHFVTADRQRLKQVFMNLLSNAIKYNRPEGRVAIRCGSGGNGRLHIHFEDTGRGIAPEEMPRLFAPFERLGADEGPIEGTGIGLAISQRLVGLMNGSLTATSEIDQGSTFTVSLVVAAPVERVVPLIEAPDVPDVPDAPNAPQAAATP